MFNFIAVWIKEIFFFIFFLKPNSVFLQMKVQDNKLFVIEPKKGKMQPGESQVIKFTYRHTMAGTDRLPVLFKVARGREILVSVSKQ